ncbi:MAG: tyrosine-protein phosphatase [Gammaproteobacteria bacterium]
MAKIFWLLPGCVAGRAGPNREPWTYAELQQAGVRAVLSVNDGELCHAGDLSRHGLAYTCLPLSPNAPPRRGDLEHCLKVLPETYEFVQAQLAEDRPVLIHCTSGKDRTCLALGYFLMRHEGLQAAEAMVRVLAVRPVAFSAEGWAEFALEVLNASRVQLQVMRA